MPKIKNSIPNVDKSVPNVFDTAIGKYRIDVAPGMERLQFINYNTHHLVGGATCIGARDSKAQLPAACREANAAQWAAFMDSVDALREQHGM